MDNPLNRKACCPFCRAVRFFCRFKGTLIMAKKISFIHSRVDDDLKNAIERAVKTSRNAENESAQVRNILNHWWRGHIVGYLQGVKNFDDSFNPDDTVEITILVPRRLHLI